MYVLSSNFLSSSFLFLSDLSHFTVFISASTVSDLRAVTSDFSLSLDEKKRLCRMRGSASPVQCHWPPLCLGLMDRILAGVNQ